ncbi:formyltransferase [Methylobacterium radiotolerans]|jgi:formylmethanofuran dehydrogenase subunit B|uniref:formyltransferase n=1 Tax=Methylobacterium TaxID=407 RepID=UPI0005E04721|nr:MULTISPECIES: formyltransferase [Methylobacterium]MBN6820476.1 formyltransferase [Methylobacterium organophilum]OXE42519.1 formyltransferase [Methylobacterium radiotolerans]GAN47149.1 tungsten-containing formylmethanofuran dehydrogenase subunit B [Methylobacterium sp. ME121]
MAAWVKGGATDAGTAIEAAASLLAKARAPVIAGLSADVAAIRAAYDLAGRIGASVDTAGSAGTYAELGSLSRVGALTSTPAEAVGRADVVLVVGAAPWQAPLLKRLVDGKPSRGRAAGSDRTLLAVGANATASLSWPAEGGLTEAVGVLRAHARGHLAGDDLPGRIAARLAAAQYGVLLYDAAELGEVGIEMLQGLAMELSETTRCFTLAVGGTGQDRAVVPVSAWLTGQAPRSGFGRRVPEHDPWRFDAARQVAAGEVDAVLWLGAVPVSRPDWLSNIPSVALVADGEAKAAEVVISVGQPGRDHGGVLWNEQRAALTFWPASAPSDLPSAASVLGALRERLVTGPAASRSESAC